MNILLVSRDERFSPSRTGADAAILEAVGQELSLRGCSINKITECELAGRGVATDTDAVFSMARGGAALDMLQSWGGRVVNRPDSVRHMDRTVQAGLLSGLMPKTVLCPTDCPEPPHTCFPCWVKRADSHAMKAADVCFVAGPADLRSAVDAMCARGIGQCIVQAHAAGCVVKFYGVTGAGLLDAMPQSPAAGKFGLETHNSVPRPDFRLDRDKLEHVAMQAAALLGMDVWGGDAVIDADGSMTIVDFNDWPSFSTCRDMAAKAIAGLAFM